LVSQHQHACGIYVSVKSCTWSSLTGMYHLQCALMFDPRPSSCCCCCRCCCCRFFVETSATLFTTVLGQREGKDASSDHVMDYWLSDSNQGSFRIQVRSERSAGTGGWLWYIACDGLLAQSQQQGLFKIQVSGTACVLAGAGAGSTVALVLPDA
jgi:hypothetical protein